MPRLSAVDAYNPSSTLIPINRAGGVTRAVSAPNAGDKLFAGRAAIIDMTGGVNSVMKPDAAQDRYDGFFRRADVPAARVWEPGRQYANISMRRGHMRQIPNDYVRRTREDRFALSDLKALKPVDRRDPAI